MLLTIRLQLCCEYCKVDTSIMLTVWMVPYTCLLFFCENAPFAENFANYPHVVMMKGVAWQHFCKISFCNDAKLHENRENISLPK